MTKWWTLLPIICLCSAFLGPAKANPQEVRDKCASDFISLCGQFKPYSLQGNACMRKNELRLSPECQKVLIASGYKR